MCTQLCSSTLSQQQEGHQCFVPGTGAAAEGERQENPSALFAACCDLKEKENVGPKQKAQLYQLVWTELAASMRKGAVPTHRARKLSPGKCPVGLLGKEQALPITGTLLLVCALLGKPS